MYIILSMNYYFKKVTLFQNNGISFFYLIKTILRFHFIYNLISSKKISQNELA